MKKEKFLAAISEDLTLGYDPDRVSIRTLFFGGSAEKVSINRQNVKWYAAVVRIQWCGRAATGPTVEYNFYTTTDDEQSGMFKSYAYAEVGHRDLVTIQGGIHGQKATVHANEVVDVVFWQQQPQIPPKG